MGSTTLTRMSVAEAADVWETTKRKVTKLQPELAAAAEVLKEHFRKTGKSDYKGRIGYSKGQRKQLDTDHVKLALFDQLDDFLKVVTYETLTLLGD
jgi:hypothetical protein